MPRRRIVDAWMETPNVRTIRLGFQDEPIDFKPGQFLTLAEDFRGYKRPVRRAYSIASSPLHRDFVDITLKREVPGVMSTHLTEAPIGAEVECVGPSGKFLYEPSMGDKLLLLGAGSGITPLHSIARYCLEGGNPDADVTLFFSVRGPRDVIYEKTWSELVERHPDRFHYFVTATRAKPTEWTGRRGRVDAAWVREVAGDVSGHLAYICGPGPMVESAETLCAELGLAESNIHSEKW